MSMLFLRPAISRMAGISVVFLSFFGCGGEEGPTPPPPRGPVVVSVTVAPATASITVGSTVQLTATVEDAAGKELSGYEVTWESDAPGVAMVSQTGLVTGVSSCLATITARSEDRHGAASITVSAPEGSAATTGGAMRSCGQSASVPAGQFR